MADELSVKDWVYIASVPVQILFGSLIGVLGRWWWDRRKWKKDRQIADELREQDREKADAEKIAAVLSSDYDKVDKAFHRLKKTVDKLRKQKIVSGLTEFDVLVYMYRNENWRKFEITHNNDSRNEIVSDVDEIMNFFRKFQVSLFPIMQDKACPKDINLEFSHQISEMGATIYPFVEKRRQDVVKQMLKYFQRTDYVLETPSSSSDCSSQIRSPQAFRSQGSNEAASSSQTEMSHMPGTSNANQPSRGEPQASREGTGRSTTDTTNEVSALLGSPNANQQSSGDQEASRGGTGLSTSDIEMSQMPGPSNANQPSSEGSQGPELKPYPGNTVIENEIPYIEYFKYKDGKMSCNLTCRYSAIETLAMVVEMGQMQEKNNQMLRKLEKIEPDARDNLLHSLRMVMFKLLKYSNFGKNQLFLNFANYAELCVNLPSNVNKKVVIEYCKRSLQDIEAHIRNLRDGNAGVKALLESTTTKEFLKDYEEKMRLFIKDSLSPSPHPANRRHSCP